MYISPLRKLLKDDKQCNPFNDAYEYESLLAKIFTGIPKEEMVNDPLLLTLRVIPFMNDHYKDYYQLLKKCIFGSNLLFDQLLGLLFAVFNRNYQIIHRNKLAAMKGQEGFNLADHYSYKIETLTGKAEASSALELETECMNTILNYLRYYETHHFDRNTSLPELHPIEMSKRIFFASSLFVVIKEEYDNSIWNDGYWSLHKIDGRAIFNIIYPQEDLLITGKTGLIRLGKNPAANFMGIQDHLKRETPYGLFIRGLLKRHKKEKRIKQVRINNGNISCKLAKGFAPMNSITELKNMVELLTFYSFLQNTPLPKLEGLELTDLIGLFSLLQELLEHSIENKMDDSIFSFADTHKFPVKISQHLLIDYFTQRTDYSHRQINLFIGLISAPFGERINLWDKPLVLFRGHYYISYLPALQPILLNMVDFWIGQGGFNLDQRGKFLEQYLTSTLREVLQEKKFQNTVPQSGKLFNRQKQYEEVDLVLNLKEIVVIAEVKCIKFPMEARDRHNAMKRLDTAAKQVTRKLGFIREHAPDLVGQIGDTTGKTFIPLIITNYPVYTTHQIRGITITDFYLLESYLRIGRYEEIKLHADGRRDILQQQLYYHNELEMNHNFVSFFKNPIPVDSIKKLFEMVHFKITPDMVGYDIYVSSAQIK